MLWVWVWLWLLVVVRVLVLVRAGAGRFVAASLIFMGVRLRLIVF